MKGIKNITHASFYCNDFEQMFSFYRDTLELQFMFTLRYEDGTPWLTYLKVAPLEFIELFNNKYEPKDSRRNQGYSHIALMVEDIHEAARTLERKGLKLTHGPADEEKPFRRPYLVEGELSEHKTYSFFIQDPEGNEIEYVQLTKESPLLAQ